VSLRLRLALWYGLLASLVVTGTTLLTYALHTRGHYDDLDYALVALARHVQEEYEKAPPTEAAGYIRNPAIPGLIIRLYDSEGHLLAASPGLMQPPGPRRTKSRRRPRSISWSASHRP